MIILSSYYNSMKKKIIHIAFRMTSENRFTIPVLLNALEKNGLSEHCCFHFLENLKGTVSFILNEERSLLCYSFMTSNLHEVYQEIRSLKSHNTSSLLMAGGPHATGNPEETLKMGFDVVIAGDAEISFPEWISSFIENPQSIPKGIIKGKNISLEKSFPVSKHFSMIPPLEITRGCFYKCTFCQTGSSNNIRHRSLESIENYLDQLQSCNTTHRASFICPSGLEYGSDKPGKSNPEILEKLFAMVHEKGFRHFEYGIFPSEIRVNTITGDLLKLIKKFCSNQKITIGAQSGSDAMLKKIRRGHTIEQVETAMDLAASCGFRPQIDIILGLPEETESDQTQTLHWIKKVHHRFGTRIQVHYFLPLSGTPLENKSPAPLSDYCRRTLKKYYRDGIATNWWETGERISQSIIKTRKLIYQSDSL